jgi:hypothetical protein
MPMPPALPEPSARGIRMHLKSTTARLNAAGIGFTILLAVLRTFGISHADFAPSAERKEAVEISREVQAERRRVLEERADNLQKIGAGVVTGDLATIMKQAEENARRPGGGQ